MKSVYTITVITVAVFIALFSSVLSLSCGSTERNDLHYTHSTNGGSQQTDSLQLSSKSEKDSVAKDNLSRESSIQADFGLSDITRQAAILTEIAEYEPPADINSDVFSMLKTVLIKSIYDTEGLVKRDLNAVPSGSDGRIVDLRYDTDKQCYCWSYVNAGDYDLSGEVSVADITPIAMNYLAVVNDTIGDDYYEEWLDGDGNGEVGISDIAIIAQCYFNTVDSYLVLAHNDDTGTMYPSEIAVPFGEMGVFPKVFQVDLPIRFDFPVAVAPIDNEGNMGDISDLICFSAPSISDNVRPTTSFVDSMAQISVSVYGTPPFAYQWDFGCGALPSTTKDKSPVVLFTSEGIFDASLVVTSDFGTARSDFSYRVYPQNNSQIIDDVVRTGGHTSIALDSKGHPHISYCTFGYAPDPGGTGSSTPVYCTSTIGGDLKYIYFNGVEWSSSVVEPAGSKVCFCDSTSITLDSKDMPHIAYHVLQGDLIKFASKDGESWNYETIDEGICTSMALDPGDNPCIAYISPEPSFDLKFASKMDNTWSTYSVDENGDFATKPSLRLDSSNNPHIAYFDRSAGHLKYAAFSGNEWTTEIVDGSDSVGAWPAIALDSFNLPHISYFDYLNCDLRYASFNGEQWIIEAIDTEYAVGKCTSLVLDENDNAHIAYYSLSYGDLKYADNCKGSWTIQTLDGPDHVGEYTAISLDVHGQKHISYYDMGNGYLKYILVP